MRSNCTSASNSWLPSLHVKATERHNPEPAVIGHVESCDRVHFERWLAGSPLSHQSITPQPTVTVASHTNTVPNFLLTACHHSMQVGTILCMCPSTGSNSGAVRHSTDPTREAQLTRLHQTCSTPQLLHRPHSLSFTLSLRERAAKR